MDPELKAEILHLVEYARGETTKQLWLDIQDLRAGKVWKFKEPEDQPALQLMLLGLAAIGQIQNVPGTGWLLSSAVPSAQSRRTFEEVSQGSLFE